MGMGPLSFEIILTFFVTAAVLYRYGNWYRHHILVTVAVLIAWYFSMLIVFVLPLDVSNTIYETCLHDVQQAALEASVVKTTSPSITTLRRDPRSLPLDMGPLSKHFYDNYDDGKQHPLGKNIHQQQQGPSDNPVQMDRAKGIAQMTPNTHPSFKESYRKLDEKETHSLPSPLPPGNNLQQLDPSNTPMKMKTISNGEPTQSHLVVKELFRRYGAMDTHASPSPPPPGYDDNTVLGAAVNQMMSSINQTKGTTVPSSKGKTDINNRAAQPNAGLSGKDNDIGKDFVSDTATVKTSIDLGKTEQPSLSNEGGQSFVDKPELVLDTNNSESSNHIDPDAGLFTGNSSEVGNSTSDYHPAPVLQCREPWSRVKPGVFPAFWRVVYWTSQVLTWLVLPLMQSYTKAGEFTVWGKLRSALIDNAIYYGSYLLIVGILLLYIALRPDLFLDGSQLRAITASASNTWGLFWLVLLLGYGLVEVPRGLWRTACPQFMLNKGYFSSAKLAHERAEAWDHLNDLLQSVQSVGSSIGTNHPLRSHLDTVESRVPTELLDRMRRTTHHDSPHADVPSEKALVRLHKQLLKALQHHNRVETQWGMMVDRVIFLEDAQRNSCSHDSHFKHSTPRDRSNLVNMLYTPTLEWMWVCRVRGYLLRCLSLLAALVSAAVVWSELTFFTKTPTLSIFAIMVNIAKSNYDYITIEVISSLIMAYIALCAYSTLFAVRVLNLYYLAPHHQTDQYSLIFSGMMLCRLTPPMCLNFLSLIHMDSHVISIHTQETHYTQIMGHMDVISIISDGFNVYFPMMIVALCLATYYSLGSRLLSALGFQQFIGSDGFTTDLIDEGRTLINRECRKRQRQQESAARRREFTERFGVGESTTSLYRSARQRAEELLSRPYRRDPANEASQMELLTSNSPHYSADSPHSPHHHHPAAPDSSQTTQYTTTSHYTSDPANYTGEDTQYSSPRSSHYNTHYSSNSRYSSTDDGRKDGDFEDSPTGGFGMDRYSRVRSSRPDKGLFDDV